MIYTVGEMAQKLGVPASTLRYYDKEGLLPFVERSSGGIRMFRENDFEWLQVIRCMKKAGMSIKDIRQYIELSMQGDDTIDTRLEMFRHQREVLTQQIQQLQHSHLPGQLFQLCVRDRLLLVQLGVHALGGVVVGDDHADQAQTAGDNGYDYCFAHLPSRRRVRPFLRMIFG